jgi:predicted HTH domain antitoxin
LEILLSNFLRYRKSKAKPLARKSLNFLLGQRRIERQYDLEDFQKDVANIEKWENK